MEREPLSGRDLDVAVGLLLGFHWVRAPSHDPDRTTRCLLRAGSKLVRKGWVNWNRRADTEVKLKETPPREEWFSDWDTAISLEKGRKVIVRGLPRFTESGDALLLMLEWAQEKGLEPELRGWHPANNPGPDPTRFAAECSSKNGDRELMEGATAGEALARALVRAAEGGG